MPIISGGGGAGGSGTVTQVSSANDSIAVANGTTTPTLTVGTVDKLFTNNPPAANWSNNSKKITSLANGSAAADAAAFGQLPTLLAVAPVTVAMPSQYGTTELNAAPGANIATCGPFWVVVPVTINRLLLNIFVSSGNYDVGIYASDGGSGSPGTRIVSLGSTAMPGTGRTAATVASTVLQPGFYWSVFAADNGTAQITYVSYNTLFGGMTVRYDKAASFPLPASLAGASVVASGSTYVVVPLGV